MPLYKYKINIHINKQILILNNRFLNINLKINSFNLIN